MATARPFRRSVPRKMEAMPLLAATAVDAVVIELVAGMESTHCERRPVVMPSVRANPRQYSL